VKVWSSAASGIFVALFRGQQLSCRLRSEYFIIIYILYYLLCFAKFYFPIDVIKYLIALVILQTRHCWLGLAGIELNVDVKASRSRRVAGVCAQGSQDNAPLLAGCISTSVVLPWYYLLRCCLYVPDIYLYVAFL